RAPLPGGGRRRTPLDVPRSLKEASRRRRLSGNECGVEPPPYLLEERPLHLGRQRPKRQLDRCAPLMAIAHVGAARRLRLVEVEEGTSLHLEVLSALRREVRPGAQDL